MVSRVGQDPLGEELLSRVHGLGLEDSFIQRDARCPTGTVTVELSSGGIPSYTITPEVAWDHVEWNEELAKLASSASTICFGSLCQRNTTTRQTLRRFLAQAKKAIRVFDVNLRQQFYSREILDESLKASNWAKVNEEEIEILDELLGLRGETVEESLEVLRRRYALDLVALTLGENGCRVHTGNEKFQVPGLRSRVADTVGAGDSFTGALLVGKLRGKPNREAAIMANKMAARVVEKVGGTPKVEVGDLK